jgi:hypothetical protein
LGDGCLLCSAGKRIEQRDLLAAYAIAEQAVCVLAVSPSMRPHALRPQLLPALRRLSAGERPVVIIRRLDGGRYDVRVESLPAGADDGANRISEFLRSHGSGLILQR